LIEAKYLRVGLADKADEKKYAPDPSPKATNEKKEEDFFYGTCVALSAEEG
jgi:hypothetical protein